MTTLPTLLAALLHSTELKAEHGLALEGLEVLDVQRIMVTCANLWTAQSMAHFEPSAPQQVRARTWDAGGWEVCG